MARYAIIHTTKLFVVNVVEWDGDEEHWRPPEGPYRMVAIPEGVFCAPGLEVEGDNFLATPLPRIGLFFQRQIDEFEAQRAAEAAAAAEASTQAEEFVGIPPEEPAAGGPA